MKWTGHRNYSCSSGYLKKPVMNCGRKSSVVNCNSRYTITNTRYGCFFFMLTDHDRKYGGGRETKVGSHL